MWTIEILALRLGHMMLSPRGEPTGARNGKPPAGPSQETASSGETGDG
jgi:hypothetical protein